MVFQDLVIPLTAFGIIVLAGGMLSIFLWLVFLRGQTRLLPMHRLRPGGWQGREVALVFLVMLFVPGLAQGFLEGTGFYQTFYGKEPTSTQKQLWYAALAFPIIVAATYFILFIASRTRPRHLGLTTARWAQNIIVGWLASIPLTVVTLGLYELVTMWIKAKDHPLRMLESQAMPTEWLLGIFLALVIAPFLEELVFRGVLQGWLRRCSLLGHLVVAMATLFMGFLYLQEKREKPMELNPGPVIFSALLVVGYSWIVFREWRQWILASTSQFLSSAPARQVVEQTDTIREGGPPLPVAASANHLAATLLTPLSDLKNGEFTKHQRPGALAAIYGSAMLFAVFHSSVWPTPIPLFVLGLGLGWLAYRTQSLVSSITVHFLFNSVACLTLGLSMFYGKENGNAETDALRPSVAGSNSTVVPGSWLPRFK